MRSKVDWKWREEKNVAVASPLTPLPLESHDRRITESFGLERTPR